MKPTVRKDRFLLSSIRLAALSLALFCRLSTWNPSSAADAADGSLDLTSAVVMIAKATSKAEAKAFQILAEEVQARSGIFWNGTSEGVADQSKLRIVLGSRESLKGLEPKVDEWLAAHPATEAKDGYRIAIEDQSIYVVGNDPRGTLFGAGRLLRELRISRGRVLLPKTFACSSSPKYKIRGHQLGYRPKTNSYDGWDLPQWDRYMRDLVIFGCNAVELVPPRTDDNADSPHFPRPQLEMMTGMSKIADSYDMDVWVWYPAMDKDYSDAATVESALKEWSDVFKALPRLDAIFVPGGDPGHTRPHDMMALLEKQSASLKSIHPKAGMWMSPQSFNGEWFDEFMAILKKEPGWLEGIVWGPQVRVGLKELRSIVPSKYPIRAYPDITHTINCQYPVPDWDLAFALTLDREPINPRPVDQAAILHSYRDLVEGFISYSEGCNDDVNKFVWSSLAWNSDVDLTEALRQYARFFIGPDVDDAFAQALLALERNWRGPLLTNAQVEITLEQFEKMEQSASPTRLQNWRFQQALYRAYYDAYIRDRLIAETANEAEARGFLRKTRQIGSKIAIRAAETVLDKALLEPASQDRLQRVIALGEALFQSIQMQLSVVNYRAIEIGRGTTLDTISTPLNNKDFLLTEFAGIRKLETESKRVDAVYSLLSRTDPGPGGFYDELGNPSNRPHWVQGKAFADDPDFRMSSYTGFATEQGLPLAWQRDGQTLWDTPLLLRYENLDKSAIYRVRVVYGGEDFKPKVRLDADDLPIHPLMLKPSPPKPQEFDVPVEATSDGSLTLKFQLEPGRGGNGRGCQVAEVWLIPTKKP